MIRYAISSIRLLIRNLFRPSLNAISRLLQVDEEDDDDEEEADDSFKPSNESKQVKTKLLNGNSNSNTCDESFDADATLPPSPSKHSNTFTDLMSSSNTSHDAVASPDRER